MTSTPTSDLHITDRYSIGQRVITPSNYGGTITEVVITQKTYIDCDGTHVYTAIDYSVKYDRYGHVEVLPHSDVRPV